MVLFDLQADRYKQQVLGARGIPAQAISAVVAKGGGTAIAEGKTIYKWTWSSADGGRWTLFVITHGSTVVTSWVE